jgi:hypothetical protein
MPFRTAAYQETLQQGGVPEGIARAHAKAMKGSVVSDLVTKEYFETTLASKLAELKFEIVNCSVGSVGAATVTVLVALFRVGRA